jgi:hypothetical protein
MLFFRPLYEKDRGFAFPCDERGRVEMDGLSEQMRFNYLYARAMVGRELFAPVVEVERAH